ncbi:MAG: hypothetical protein ACQ9MH_15350 [Nitrospinales bacterium]
MKFTLLCIGIVSGFMILSGWENFKFSYLIPMVIFFTFVYFIIFLPITMLCRSNVALRFGKRVISVKNKKLRHYRAESPHGFSTVRFEYIKNPSHRRKKYLDQAYSVVFKHLHETVILATCLSEARAEMIAERLQAVSLFQQMRYENDAASITQSIGKNPYEDRPAIINPNKGV